MRLAAFAGKFALFLAGMALLTFISLFVVGAYLASWPIMRVSPRSRRLTSVMGLATAAMMVARAYGLDTAMVRNDHDPEPEADTEATEATEEEDLPPGWSVLPRDRCYISDTGVVSIDGRNFYAPSTDTEGGDN